ncbi:phosphopantetheine-binding protein [Actinomadura sp. DC4]|uniref:acyl carrier protein n=1 Tax=Actinomadura sp. DC4 TaxID=3055069 RepID=UPI0025B10F1E|nr:phosphopantetheine-binding protein [Actinomadura sp. DC4]MDN3359003.1 phosphopantetheine-binding protein [Actinomadura sp. DC4]
MTIDDFAVFVRDEIGLDVTPADVGKSFDELPGWDSVHLLSLLTALERSTGRPLSLPDLLDAASLEQIYAKAVS